MLAGLALAQIRAGVSGKLFATAAVSAVFGGNQVLGGGSMALARGEVFIRLVHGALVLGLVFLALEVHQLRVAVEDVGLGYDGDDRVERLIASLDQPLQTIGRRLGRVSEALGRPVMVSGDPAVPAVAGGMTHAVSRARDVPAARPVDGERRLVSTQLESQLGALVAAVQRIDKRPKVSERSLPPPSSSARGIDRQAVNKTLASLRSSPLEKSRFLTMTPKELLARYGKPTTMYIGQDDGTVSWAYDLSATDAGAWLAFKFYDGRVIAVDY